MSPIHLTKEQAQEIAALLKSSREQQGENLVEVAFRIALSPSQLRAIESGDLRPFYSAGYFLQAAERYANFLNIKLPQRLTRDSDQAEVIGISIAQESIQTAESQEKSHLQALTEKSETNGNLSSADSQPRQFDISKVGTRPLGWLVFGAAALITVGITKINFDKPALPEPPVNAASSATVLAMSDNNSGVAAPTPLVPAASPVASPATPQDRLTNPASRTMGELVSGPSDSHLESQAQTWVQLVKTNGEKTNLKIEPGQKIEFTSGTTAAVVFGQPDKTVLKVKDKTVNLKPFITMENPSRALVILSQIRD